MQIPMQLVIHLDGGTDAQVFRAGLVAMAVFERAGVSPSRAAEASFAREGWDMSGFDPDYEGYTGEDAEIAHLWDAAHEAAREAAKQDWPADREDPPNVYLEIKGYPEEEDDEDLDEEAEMERMLAIFNQSATT